MQAATDLSNSGISDNDVRATARSEDKEAHQEEEGVAADLEPGALNPSAEQAGSDSDTPLLQRDDHHAASSTQAKGKGKAASSTLAKKIGSPSKIRQATLSASGKVIFLPVPPSKCRPTAAPNEVQLTYTTAVGTRKTRSHAQRTRSQSAEAE